MSRWSLFEVGGLAGWTEWMETGWGDRVCRPCENGKFLKREADLLLLKMRKAARECCSDLTRGGPHSSETGSSLSDPQLTWIPKGGKPP